MTADAAREVLAVRYGYRVTSRAESYLNFHLYGEPDTDLDIDYYFWVISDGAGVVLVDTGFAPEVGDRRRRTHFGTPARALPRLGIDPADVTAVVLSHAHWDHIGNVRQFPHAQLVMTEAEYAFWTSPLAGRGQFAAHCEPEDIDLLRARRRDGTITLFTGQLTLASGIDLVEVGGHTPGQLIAVVATTAGASPRGGAPVGAASASGTADGTADGTVVLASDALHFYDEVERDRPFAVLADLPAMYRAYDTLAELAARPGTSLVAGHDPLVRERFAAYQAAARPSGAAGGTPGTAADARLQVTDLTRPLPG